MESWTDIRYLNPFIELTFKADVRESILRVGFSFGVYKTIHAFKKIKSERISAHTNVK